MWWEMVTGRGAAGCGSQVLPAAQPPAGRRGSQMPHPLSPHTLGSPGSLPVWGPEQKAGGKAAWVTRPEGHLVGVQGMKEGGVWLWGTEAVTRGERTPVPGASIGTLMVVP